MTETILKLCSPSQGEIEKAMEERLSKQSYEKLKTAEIGIAGLGGLGSNIAIMLTRSGVGHLHLVDFDRVELTNLNRQAYRICHLNMLKTEALKKILLEINPYLNITTETLYVTNDNAKAVFGRYPIVCEAFDNPENKAILVNALLEECPDMKIVSASGMAGYGSANAIATTKVMRNFYVCGDGITDVNEGISMMAPRVNICAGHQANMVIRLILGEEKA